MKKKLPIIASFVLATFIFTSIFFFIKANRPMARAKKEAVGLARKYSDLKEVDFFYWFNRKESYFTVAGKDSSKNDIYVIIPRSGEKVTILDQDAGVDRDKVLKKVINEENPDRITKINLGMVKDKPTWEVVGQSNDKRLEYYLVDFKTGEIEDSLRGI
ncbi:cell wall elongation regulator TseB-like domain-containing protein [Vagococcus intermedius]|uniref:DUF5590 domain-containing protein n=1 Tax=Vagococcus intermedius TaxID=2991418 RepID=A0AAF0CTE1_9ENTE|nr:DUF5590 domain-containing protein [Vagococcus intermedius]WEG72608.1 DUF5590 domain-containing protein [Vagococcus intermedius]WEG74693.1 DUF5590 domain-containing protein [Vagococcus intermedius]